MPSLSDLRWPELAVPVEVLVVALGSVEQHGRHLPFDVDTSVAAELAARLVADRPSFVLGPPLAYGASGEHEGFPGTLSIGCEVLELVLVELGRSASHWARRLLIVNGHGGNLAPLAAAVQCLRSEGHDAASWTAGVPGGDAHAGRTETSMMLALHPATVRLDAAVVGPTARLPELMPELRAAGVAAVSPSGVLGDPSGANAGEGHEVLATMSDDLGRMVDRWLSGTSEQA